MEYDPHGTELLDIVAHYLSAVRGRIWCKSIRQGLDEAKCDTDLFILLTRLTTEGSPAEHEQAEELARSLIRQDQ